jgi:hypothetical protein
MNAVNLEILEKEVGAETKVSTPDWSAILNRATVTAEELQQMNIPEREFLLQPFFKVADFGILYAQRGVGKTWLGYLIARGVSQGTSVGLIPLSELFITDQRAPVQARRGRW